VPFLAVLGILANLPGHLTEGPIPADIRSRMTTAVLLLFAILSFAGNPAFAQQPAQPVAPVPPTQPSAPPSIAPSVTPPAKGIPTKPIPGYLIIGTVFNENALSFPGVEVRVRRKDEKKYRWQTATNSRGEFALRVPEGHEYEVLVHVKKYQDQTKAVTTANGDTQQRLSIKLEPVNSAKTGAKP